MVVGLGLGDSEADGHDVEEWRARAAIIFADPKRQLIGTDPQRLARDQGPVGAAVGVGDRLR